MMADLRHYFSYHHSRRFGINEKPNEAARIFS